MTGLLEPAPPLVAAEIDRASIRLEGVPVDPEAPSRLGDHDRDGLADLVVRFDRAAVERALTVGDQVPVTVTGTVGDLPFAGTDTIRVLGSDGSVTTVVGRPRFAGAPVLTLSIGTATPLVTPSDRLRVTFTLPDASPARLEMLDIAGRVLGSRDVGSLGAGEHVVDWTEAGRAPGIYFLRLRQGTNVAHARLAIVR